MIQFNVIHKVLFEAVLERETEIKKKNENLAIKIDVFYVIREQKHMVSHHFCLILIFENFNLASRLIFFDQAKVN